MKFSALVIAAIGALSLTPAAPAAAQDWPHKPVRIVAPFAPGGSADTLGRIAAEQLGEAIKGGQFVVENRPGAGGLLGSAAVANADPDGYTFVVSGIASHVLGPIANPNAGFDPIKSFAHVAYFGGPPNVIIVHPSLGVKSLKELLELMKKSKDGTSYVSPGPGTLGQLLMEAWAQKEKLKVEHIPYKGAGQAITDLIAGHVKVGSMTWTTASAQIAGGKVVPLAVSSDKRLPDFPDVPTLKELGYPDLVAITWFSLSAPANTPKDIVDRVNQEVVKFMRKPEVQKRLEHEEIDTIPMSPEEFTKFVEAEIQRWGPVAKAVGAAMN
jgi:tripartite-type tricarboxylate transporter receptor subunit TctC